MDWKDFNRAAFEKKYKVFAFLTKTEDCNLFSAELWVEFNNCFACVIEKSSEPPTILTLQVSSEKKGFLSFGHMNYQEKNLIKCIDKYKTHNNWRIYNTQIWSGNRKQIMEDNTFPEFVFTVDYLSCRYPDHPIDGVMAFSFEQDFYNAHKALIDISVEKFRKAYVFRKGFVYTRSWFVGFLSPEGAAAISSRIAGVDGVLSSINLVNPETLEWNN